jgi:hypothetical protein
MNLSKGAPFMDKIQPTTGKPVPPHIRRHLREQQRSSESVRKYCCKKGISAWTFYKWRARYGKPSCSSPAKASGTSTPAMAFTSLGTFRTIPQQPHPLFDIRFSCGTIISIYTGATAQELAPYLDLLSVREAASC